MKRFKGTKGMIILAVLVVMLVGYYYHISNVSEEVKDETTISEVQEVLLKDMKRNYPPSPREVIKYFSQLSKCVYDGKCSEDELEQLYLKMNELFDDELLKKQEDVDGFQRLKDEIAKFEKNSWTISSFAPSASVDVEYFREDGYEFARMYCLYNIRQGTQMVSTNEVFVLRKDEEGHYKIYGWDVAEVKDEE